MTITTVKISDADRAAALELCELWIPLSRQEEVAEIIAKHVRDDELQDKIRELRRQLERPQPPEQAEKIPVSKYAKK